MNEAYMCPWRCVVNDRWQGKRNERWNDPERDRVSRLFRYHIRSTYNPKGEIVRQPCHFHPDVEGEGHHVDYTKPFLVAWLGGKLCGCHRKADHGSLTVTPDMLHDYSGVVRLVPQRGRRRSKTAIEVPF